jgi:hypothetical protein
MTRLVACKVHSTIHTQAALLLLCIHIICLVQLPDDARKSIMKAGDVVGLLLMPCFFHFWENDIVQLLVSATAISSQVGKHGRPSMPERLAHAAAATLTVCSMPAAENGALQGSQVCLCWTALLGLHDSDLHSTEHKLMV